MLNFARPTTDLHITTADRNMNFTETLWIPVGVVLMICLESSGHLRRNPELQYLRPLFCCFGILFYLRILLSSLHFIFCFALFATWAFGGFEGERVSSAIGTLVSWLRQAANEQQRSADIVNRHLTEGDMRGQQSLTCAICREEQQVGDVALVLPCGHCYHERCVRSWVIAVRTCPTCRRIVWHFETATELLTRVYQTIKDLAINRLELQSIG